MATQKTILKQCLKCTLRSVDFNHHFIAIKYLRLPTECLQTFFIQLFLKIQLIPIVYITTANQYNDFLLHLYATNLIIG